MVRWHLQLDGREFEQARGVGDANREAWRAAVHGVTHDRRVGPKSWTPLSY